MRSKINLPDEAFIVIGRIIAEWAEAEFQLTMLLVTLIRHSELQGPADLRRYPDFKRRLKLYRAYMDQLYTDSGERKATRELLERLDRAHDDRDWVAHAIPSDLGGHDYEMLGEKADSFTTKHRHISEAQMKEVLYRLLILKEDFSYHILDSEARFRASPYRERLLAGLQSRPPPDVRAAEHSQLRSSLGLPSA